MPKDVLDLTILGLYKVDDNLNESLDQFLTKAAIFIDDSVQTTRSHVQVLQNGATLWMSNDEDKQIAELPYDRPINIHDMLKTNALGLRYTVTGEYLYFHYM